MEHNAPVFSKKHAMRIHLNSAFISSIPVLLLGCTKLLLYLPVIISVQDP